MNFIPVFISCSFLPVRWNFKFHLLYFGCSWSFVLVPWKTWNIWKVCLCFAVWSSPSRFLIMVLPHQCSVLSGSNDSHVTIHSVSNLKRKWQCKLNAQRACFVCFQVVWIVQIKQANYFRSPFYWVIWPKQGLSRT